MYMIQECRKKYDKDNIVFLAGRQTGIFDRVGSHLDFLPVWRCDEQKECQLDIILYGAYTRGERGEWTPPQGIIKDARGTLELVWLPVGGNVGSPAVWRREGEPSKWQRFPRMGAEWWNARERIIGCCEKVGKLFQRRNEDLSNEEVAFVRNISTDYQLLLPPELFEQCQKLYPDFFEWLMEWLEEV